MGKLFRCLVTAGALIGSVSSTSAFEAMLGRNFTLYAHPHSRERVMTIGAGEMVEIDACDHGWCVVTHGPHAGYIYLSRILDGNVYAEIYRGRRYGSPADVAAGVVAAPINAGVSILR